MKNLSAVALDGIKRFQNASTEDLAQIAKFANLLAKKPVGDAHRSELYRLKSAALSVLITRPDCVVFGGVRPDGAIGLTIRTASVIRLHVPPRSLSPQAQAVIRERAGFVPVVYPSLGERLAAALAA